MDKKIEKLCNFYVQNVVPTDLMICFVTYSRIGKCDVNVFIGSVYLITECQKVTYLCYKLFNSNDSKGSVKQESCYR